METTITKIWYTYFEGYRARVANIPRENNWYLPVRPESPDTKEWFNGWDKAEQDMQI